MNIVEEILNENGKEVLVIPAIGINHNGSLDVAKQMVLSAHRAGAKLIKHQTHICEDEMCSAAKKVIPGNSDESIYNIMENCIIGNSSAGIREAGYYGIPAIDIGTRQQGRYNLKEHQNIQWVTENSDAICDALIHRDDYRKQSFGFGDGKSTERFMKILSDEELWNKSLQKKFVPL